MNRAKKAIVFAILSFALVIIVVGVLIYNGILWLNTPSRDTYPVRGVDVSSYQGEINWDVLAQQNIDFAFVKATEGSSYVDSAFSFNWEAAQQTELLIGAYHFFSYDSAGQTQAEHFINMVPKREGMLPPVVDVEFYGDKEKNLPLYEDVYRELSVMLTQLEQYYGVKPIIYATQKAYRLYLEDAFTEYPLWIREVIGVPSQQWEFWQYSHRGRLEGYNGEEKYIDMNVFARDYKDLADMCI